MTGAILWGRGQQQSMPGMWGVLFVNHLRDLLRRRKSAETAYRILRLVLGCSLQECLSVCGEKQRSWWKGQNTRLLSEARKADGSVWRRGAEEGRYCSLQPPALRHKQEVSTSKLAAQGSGGIPLAGGVKRHAAVTRLGLMNPEAPFQADPTLLWNNQEGGGAANIQLDMWALCNKAMGHVQPRSPQTATEAGCHKWCLPRLVVVPAWPPSVPAPLCARRLGAKPPAPRVSSQPFRARGFRHTLLLPFNGKSRRLSAKLFRTRRFDAHSVPQTTPHGHRHSPPCPAPRPEPRDGMAGAASWRPRPSAAPGGVSARRAARASSSQAGTVRCQPCSAIRTALCPSSSHRLPSSACQRHKTESCDLYLL